MGRLSVSGDEALREKKISDSTEMIVREFMHIYNLFVIYGQEKLDSYKKELREQGLSNEYILSTERRGALMSNWGKDKYVAERCEGKGMAYHNMSKAR